MNTSANNKRIAKNTLMLYIRMLLTMAVSLYTVRVVLDTLGTVDYGLYNVVGGVVTMFSFLSNTMASASQRFFSFELGRKNYDQLKKTFSMTMTIYVLIAVLILVLAETVGLWFLNHKMTIPADRMEAANWVYQFSILSFMMTMLTIPYNAAIIAHEKMNVFAYVSIIEVSLKLLIVYLLLVFSFDKLKLYAILVFGVTTLTTYIYRTYTTRKFIECKYSFYWHPPLFKELIGYSGWNLFGALAGILHKQGVNILLNMFFGPIINAARGISYQINNAISQLVQSFMTAVRPQIIKYYASNEIEKMHNLTFSASKLSYFLLLFISTPLMLGTPIFLTLWLKDSPQITIIFVRLIIVNSLIESLSYSLMTAVQSTGQIKHYQIIVGGIWLLNLPLSYLFLKLGYNAESTFIIAIILSMICFIFRLIILKRLINLNIKKYFKEVFYRSLLTSILLLTPFTILYRQFSTNTWILLSLTPFYITYYLLITYKIGMNKNERKLVSHSFNILSKFKT